MNLLSLGAATMFMILAGACSNKEDRIVHEHNHGHSHDHEQEHKHSHANHSHTDSNDLHDEHDINNENHEGVIEIEPVDAEMMGIKADIVQIGAFREAMHVSGIVEAYPTDVYTAISKSRGIVRLSPTLVLGKSVGTGTLIATVDGTGVTGGDENSIAYNQMLTAKREYERLKPLMDDGIVSIRDYNAAEAAYREAEAAYAGSKSGSRITSGISGTVTDLYVTDGAFVEVGDPIAKVSKTDKMILRVDLPTRLANAVRNQGGGTVKFIGSDADYTMEQLEAKRQSQQAVNTVGAYIPVYYVIKNIGGIVPGMVAEVYLESCERQAVMSVPLTAVSEQQGVNFVYVKLDEDCYKKVPVLLGASNGKSVEVKSGLQPGQEVVTEGMIFVKLAESNVAVPEGHSHTH